MLTSRDWIFGSRPRRLVLDFVLSNDPGEEGWTKAALADKAGVHRKGGVDEHVRGLVALDLLDEREGRFWPADPDGGLAEHLRRVLSVLEKVPENRITEEAEGKVARPVRP